MLSLRTGSWLADVYRPGHLGYVLLRGEVDGEGLRLSTGDFIPAAGKAPGRKMAVVMDTVLLAVAGSTAAEPLDSPRAVRSGKISLLHLEAGTTIARHRHEWVEELCLVSGDLRLQDVELGPEDYHRAAAGSTHDEARSVGGCTMVYITRKTARAG